MRRICTFTIWFVIQLALAAPCLAQIEAPEIPPKSYVMPYFIVGAGIGLGLVAVCRASKRRKEIRRPD